MSAFPTGVAIVTTLDGERRPRGLTTSAVCSVSAEPPLLLVCVDVASRTLPALREEGRFVVNFVGHGGAELASRFATKGDDKFDGVHWVPGLGGLPLLVDDAIAHAECAVERELEAGDHIVFIGIVERARPPGPESLPILYHRRAYGTMLR